MSKISIFQGAAPATAASIATASQNTAIHAATACNTSGASATLDVWLSHDGAGQGNANKIYDALTIDAGASVSLSLLINHAMPTNAKIFAQASAASAVTLTISGVR